MQNTEHLFAAKQVSFSEIPQIDVGALLGNDAAAKRAVAREIYDACSRVGFFYIHNHGVPKEVVDNMFAAIRAFFALPHAEKMEITADNSLQHRGYVTFNLEHVDPNSGKDLHEALDFGRELPPGMTLNTKTRSLYGPNQWPRQLPTFKPAVNAYYEAMLALGNRLLRGFALSLELEEEFFLDKFNHAAGWLRTLHYPPQHRIEADKRIGQGAHTDYECFTMLAQDDNNALQVQNLEGEWIKAPPIDGTFVINIADLMARWSNDIFRSTMHRVINFSGRDRYSIPFFLGPNADTEVTCLPTCVRDGALPKYGPVKASDWILQRVLDSRKDLLEKEMAP